ncbi:hypothetical protein [Wenxinia saemankumensis]|uniref:DUF1127 domain-containing protein n=1 Tax=Wenxinia saemankumensis TaxID=1447782 RepID=A0A1M6GRG0_9RHOB|nr:hypothetical protein [Wenxinia saemankumensis]SHJ12466.1 hypothetical protein SAMN05444417_2874 [Wenxinia saemankumensis]
MTFFDTVRARIARRAAYARTLRELSGLDPRIARDLDMDRTDPRDIAYRAVYGA